MFPLPEADRDEDGEVAVEQGHRLCVGSLLLRVGKSPLTAHLVLHLVQLISGFPAASSRV